MNNLGKSKSEIIYELVLSLNKGNSMNLDNRVYYAIMQYNQLIEAGIIEEEKEKGEKNERL